MKSALKYTLFAMLFCLSGQPLLAADPGGPASQEEAEKGGRSDEELIRARREWFYGPRAEGTTGPSEMAHLRQAAVEFTRERILELRARIAADKAKAGNPWRPLGPSPAHFDGWKFGNVSGRVPALAADWNTGTIWVGSASGGLWRSTDDGHHWTEVLHDAGTQTVGAVAVDPADPDVIWVGTGEKTASCEGYFGIGILRSTDGGRTWETRNGVGPARLRDVSSIGSIAIDRTDSRHVVIAVHHHGCSTGDYRSGRVYITNDGGLSWFPTLFYVDAFQVRQDPQDPATWWAATNQGVWKSTDNATTWTHQTASGLPTRRTGRTELAIAPSNGDIVYALFQTGRSHHPELWRTTDGGVSWQLMSSGDAACDGQCGYNMALAVDPRDPDAIYRGNVLLYRSRDGGRTWVSLIKKWSNEQEVHQDIHYLLIDPTHPDTIWIGCDGGVWKTTDGGSTFENRNGNLNLTQFYKVNTATYDTSIVCGGAQDNSSLVRTDGDVWELEVVTGDGFGCYIVPGPDGAIYSYAASYFNKSSGYPSIYRSTNGILGAYKVITDENTGIERNDRWAWDTPYVVDPTNPSILLLGSQRMYRSTDRGDHWHSVSGELAGDGGVITTIEIHPRFPRIVFAGTRHGDVWVSDDGGDNWQEISEGLPKRQVNDIASDPRDPARALAVVSGFNTAHLWEWRGGREWKAVGNGLPNVPANAVVILDNGQVFVGTDTGVFRSLDGGRSFDPFMEGLPRGLVISHLVVDEQEGKLLAGTYGRGAWQIEPDPVGPVVQFDSIERPLVEVDGDGDGSIEAGEAWEVRPILRNFGSDPARDVTARLATRTPRASIAGSDVRSYGDLGSGEKAGATERYRFALDPHFCASRVTFDVVDIRSSNEPWRYDDVLSAFTLKVVDQTAPVGGITFPEDGACFGPSEIPVIILDDFRDNCEDLHRRYRPMDPDLPTPGQYASHGDWTVYLEVTDPMGNTSYDHVSFTIDTVPPTVEILHGPGEQWVFPQTVPFTELFAAADDDGAGGGVVHELVEADGCVLYDGYEYGDGDGLLSDEMVTLDQAALCRAAQLCHRDAWNYPVVRVHAWDCGGNEAVAAMQVPVAFTLAPGVCEPPAGGDGER